mgnify:FL=1
MALIVENGTGKSDAESYISVADADTYVTNYRGATHAWLSLDNTTKEVLLRRAALYLDTHYLNRWKGHATTSSQRLQWPRIDAVTASGWYLDYDSIPEVLGYAQVEAAIRFNEDSENVQPDLTRGGKVKSEKVDVIAITYMDGAPARTVYTQVEEWLKDLIIESGRMVRS